ncbi:MAG: lipid-A-disaccharide synthase [Candidatus Binatota bacterium]|jgi:lipid-A-disaccharide synthase|nr:lipid-A-disaccharide synthase [Candidatus Binatota bacterium]
MPPELTSPPRTIFIVTGDVSGDQSAGRLAAAIRAVAPDVRLVGVGGPEMSAAGVSVVERSSQLSFVGLLAGLRKVRVIHESYRRVQRLVAAEPPDVVVLIDGEFVTMPFARWLRARGIPAVFFFPPQFWVLGRYRMRRLVPLAQKVLSAFSEEAKLYRALGADAHWVGHPLRDLVRVPATADSELRELGLDPARPVVAILPGSRAGEVRRLARRFLAAARLLELRDPTLQFAIPLADEGLRGDIEKAVRESHVSKAVVYVPRSYAVLGRARIAIQKSGTGTLETALLGVPAVVAYRLNLLEYLVGWYVLMEGDFIGMVNILLGEMIQPELVQGDVTAERVAAEAWSLLTDERRRAHIRSRLADLKPALGPGGAIEYAARQVLAMLPGGEAEDHPGGAAGLRQSDASHGC